MSVGLKLFCLFTTFGNNTFSLVVFMVRGSFGYGQQNPMQGTIPAQGENSGIPSSQGIWNLWQG
jgi:hypothetical protein